MPFIYKYKVKTAKKYLAIIYLPAILTVIFAAWQLSLNQGFPQLLLQYLPTNPIATVLGLGILFPVVLLVVLQTKVLVDSITFASVRFIVLIIFFSFLCATNVYNYVLRNYVAHTDQAVDVVYMQEEEFKMFIYLNAHTPQNSGVLASVRMTNLIPAFTRNRGSMGSVTDTYTHEINAVDAFYAVQPTAKDYLKKNNISYVLWGPTEQAITTRYARGEIPDLRQLYKI